MKIEEFATGLEPLLTEAGHDPFRTRTQRVTITEQALLLTRRLDDWRRVVELIGSLSRPSSDALRPSQPWSISYAFCLTAAASFLSCSRPVCACSLYAYACLFLSYQPTYVTARRRVDAAPQRALSLALYIGQTFYPPRILRFGHFSSITYRLDKKVA